MKRAIQPGPFAVFRRRNFTLLWTAEFISTMGNGLTAIAAAILVYRVTGSALNVGLMLIAGTAPALLVGLVAGVFVDRGDRKRIMIAADLTRAALVALIPLALALGIGWLYILVALSSAASKFFTPAQSSILPETAPDEELAAANALMTISTVGATTVGFAAAGLIATQGAVAWAFYLDAISFLGSALCIARMRVAPLPAEESSLASLARNLSTGLKTVRDRAELRGMFLIFTPVFLTFGFHNSLQLPFMIRALGGSEFEYSLLEGCFSVGFVIGSLLMASLAERIHQGQWLSLSFLSMGLAGIALAFAPSAPIAIGISLLSGLLNAPSYIGRALIIQRSTPRELRGRVSSVFLVMRDTLFVAGMLAAGLADLFDVRLLLLAEALALLACGVASFLMPGIGQPTREWRRLLAMLRAAPQSPGLGLGRAAAPADIERLAAHLPAFGDLPTAMRVTLAAQARVYEVAPGTAVLRQGAPSQAAYFLLDGRTAASRHAGDSERVIEIHQPGDFFGEIAALTGAPRTATVVAEHPSALLELPAAALRNLMAAPEWNRLILSKLAERMVRMDMIDLPRFSGLDQHTLRELRADAPAHPARLESLAQL